MIPALLQAWQLTGFGQPCEESEDLEKRCRLHVHEATRRARKGTKTIACWWLPRAFFTHLKTKFTQAWRCVGIESPPVANTNSAQLEVTGFLSFGKPALLLPSCSPGGVLLLR